MRHALLFCIFGACIGCEAASKQSPAAPAAKTITPKSTPKTKAPPAAPITPTIKTKTLPSPRQPAKARPSTGPREAFPQPGITTEVPNEPKLVAGPPKRCKGDPREVDLELLKSSLAKKKVPQALEGALTLIQARELARILRARHVCRRFVGKTFFASLYEHVDVRSIHGTKRGFFSKETTLVLKSGHCLELPPPGPPYKNRWGKPHPSCAGDDLPF